MHLDLLPLLAVLAAAVAGGRLAARLGAPPVLGELLAGIVLGPAVLGLLGPSPAVGVLADLGVLVLMLYIGMSVDPQELRRVSWSGTAVALGGFLGPAGLCLALALAWGETVTTAAFLAIAAGVTALAVNARILVDLSLMGTRLAHLIMAGALVTDVLCLVGLSAVMGAGPVSTLAELARPPVLKVLLLAVGFFGLAGVVGLGLLPRVGGPLRAAAGRLSEQPALGTTLALGLALVVAAGAEAIGLHGMVGAFVAGTFLRHEVLGRDLAAQLRGVVHDLAIGFLAPIFFVTAGFAVSFEALQGDLGQLAALIGLATVGKVLGTGLALVAAGGSWREGLVLGAAMNGRGAVEIVIAGVALEAGVIDARLFSMLVIFAMLTTVLVPVSLRVGVAWLRRHGELDPHGVSGNGVVIVGAGPAALELARELGRGRTLCLVDSSEDHCAEARAAGLEALHGDALDPAVLEAAGIRSARTLVAATTSAALNQQVLELALQEFGVLEAWAVPVEDAPLPQRVGA